MSKVSLRVYTRDIEGMIEGGQVEEAIAHCLHMLKTFPMYLETYRLLGKAFLENRQYANAFDIFQRILMAVPDDFVSHVGMSIIADDENKLDDAIWHMERAFEVQPSNPAIQGELRRLYGRREGVEPPKIRLTRDALANMYAQGELYHQAIAEIRSVLADDPARPDLQVMLARAYFHAGQKIEATEMCSALLKKYPYCFDALRILIEILPGTGRTENTQVYRHRINFLDPYAAFATGSVFQSDKVPDAAVNLERLEYEPGLQPVASQPDWASSLGIKLEEPSGARPAPDWLRTPEGETSGEVAHKESGSGVDKQESIPDWMRSAGWTESTGESVEGPVDFGEGEAVAEPIAQGEIPDWLKSMAPPEVLQEPTAAVGEPVLFGNLATSTDDQEELPDWLRPLSTSTEATDQPIVDEPEPSMAKETTASQEDVPDWLQSLSGRSEEEALQPELPKEPIVEESAAVSKGLPDWLQELAPEGETESSAVEPVGTRQPEEEQFEVEPEPVEKPVSSSEEVAKLFEGGLPSLDDQDAALAWLESLAAKQGAKEEELLTRPQDRLENAPEWVQKLSSDEIRKPTPEEVPIPEPALEGNVEEDVSPETPPELVSQESETTPDWLASLGETELHTDEDEGFPLFEGETAQVEDEGSSLSTEEIAPPSDEPVLATKGQVEDLSVTSWLQNLQAEEEEAKPELPVEDVAGGGPEAELPEWLRDIGQPAGSVEDSHPVEQPPDWLKSPEEAAKMDISQEPELPEWLSEMEEAEEKEIQQTAPQDWIPVEEKPTARVEEQPTETPALIVEEQDIEQELVPQQLLERPATAPSSSVPKPTGVLSRIPLQEKESDLLLQAQDALQQGLLNESMGIYVRLIKKGRLLDEVIHDLHEAVYRFPVDMIIWQTLGDAHMRTNRLQEALDAYTKAEELLR